MSGIVGIRRHTDRYLGTPSDLRRRRYTVIEQRGGGRRIAGRGEEDGVKKNGRDGGGYLSK